MHTVARLALHPQITNIQTSLGEDGPGGRCACLKSGANDLGGTLMNESISRAAGTQHGQEFPAAEMEALIRSIGRDAETADTLYRTCHPSAATAVHDRGRTDAGGADSAAQEGAGRLGGLPRSANRAGL